MKHISNWDDLRPYGIICLTGEACALGVRGLCDLTEQGQSVVREFLGLPYDAKFQEAWNSLGTGSCFLPWDILPSLAAFLLIRDGCLMAVNAQDGVYGREPTDAEDDWRRWLECQHGNIIRHYTPLRGQPTSGLSSVHAMSGRAQ